ncbi:MAG TPA: lactate utilization protein [Bacillota bacterium]|jgi:NAD-dependent dihydropyrimidine dehydrogenase PreA subunit|nr:lactate utilization protein [Bacillota bacterium]HRU40387.1 lactate utilization protein [Candidatus Diapherotrites archaeon]HQE66171.1 lactate utilization protein [Bacillota bacterium]HQI16277.1 lactate utilization protein [Bacillota bacterium]HQJ37026.1 lactate utilization protein [Bacillota bacterium]
MNESVKKTIEALEKHNMKASYFDDSETAVSYLMDKIEDRATVGIGGSMTVYSLGIPQKLIERGNKVYFHWLESTPEGMDYARDKAEKADVYLSSTNALTEDGKLVNIDGLGNRVASMIFGPKKVFVLCGVNKITKDLDAALKRIKENTYKNARRLKLDTPCAHTEKCNDCNSPQRMCSVTTIIERRPYKTEFEVIIIGKELGY